MAIVIQEYIKTVWQDFFNKGIDINDNFNDIGGSSIQLISMLLILNKNYSIDITIDEFLINPTITNLATLVNDQINGNFIEQNKEDKKIENFDNKPFPLSPIQHFLLQRSNFNHYNVGNIFSIDENHNIDLIKISFEKIIATHEGLRLIIRKNHKDSWEQIIRPVHELHQWWHEEELSLVNDNSIENSIRNLCNTYQEKTNVTEDTFFVVVINLGATYGKRLLVIFHHLVIDNISEKILYRDLETTYNELISKKTLSNSVSSRRVYDWFTFLDNFSQNNALQYLPYWESLNPDNYRPLPIDYPLPDNSETIPIFSNKSIQLDQKESNTVLRMQRNYKIDPSLLVLVGIIRAYKIWSKSDYVAVAMLHNGRHFKSIPNTNLLETIAWLTYFSVHYLKNNDDERGIDIVNLIKNQINFLNDDGLSYSCLKHLNNDKIINNTMNALPDYHLSYNYIPYVDNENSFFLKKSNDSCGANEKWFDADLKPFINSYFNNNHLHLFIGFSPKMHSDETIENLIESIKIQILLLASEIESINTVN